jgi:membrane dipeptidase
MLIVDAHEDLAWNMLTFGRDYTRSAVETRQLETGSFVREVNGDTLLGWPEYQRGQVALVFATLFAAPIRRQEAEWDRLTYGTAGQAYSLYSAEIDAYHRLVEEAPDKFRLIRSVSDLEELLSNWQDPEITGHPVGLTILMEGAEGVSRADSRKALGKSARGVREPGELEEWWERGVRLIGPAWAGTRFCGGTREPGPLTAEGYALLEGMADLGFTLDLSHMDEQAALQALDAYPGDVIASHANALALLKGCDSNRFLSDRVLHGLIERDGTVGIVPYNDFLLWGWTPQDGRGAVRLVHVVDQIDYVCQLAGDSSHVGLGTDFDGGFGLQSAPAEFDTIADLQNLIPLLIEKGYTAEDAAAILGGNWFSLLRRSLPQSS